MRTIASGIQAGLDLIGQEGSVKIIYLVRLCFDGGTVGWNSGHRDISFDGVTYLGLGEITSAAIAKEEAGMKAAGFSVGVSGIKPEIVSLILSEPYLGRAAYVHFTLLDAADKVITGDPVLLFRGTIDAISGVMGSSASFTLTLKSRLADWERPRKCRYTDAEQQKLHPGDRGFEYVGQMEQKKLIWPRAAFLADPRD